MIEEGSSTVSSSTPLLTENYHYDHYDAEEQQGRGNSAAQQVSAADDDSMNNDKEEVIVEIKLPILLRVSLISFWNNYVKYYRYFFRWLFFVIIINVIASVVALWFTNMRYIYENHFGSWQNYQLAISFLLFVRLATSIWFFRVAKLIDQQVINLDRLIIYEQATTILEGVFIDAEQQQKEDNDDDKNNNNDNDSAVEVRATTILSGLLPNYDNIYGRVSKKIDLFLHRKQQLPTSEDIMLSTRTTRSFLVNICYILWSFFLAATFFGITDLLVVMYYESWSKACNNYDPGPLVGFTNKLSCIWTKSLVLSTISAILILMGTGCWLLIRKGLPSGTIPFVVAIVAMLHLLLFEAEINDLHVMTTVLTTVLTSGTILFHITLCCCCSENHNNNNKNNNRLLLQRLQLPSWITKNVLIWALYGWIGAFLADGFCLQVGILGVDGEMFITALALIAFTGIILHHPIIQLMGICSIVLAVIVAIISFFFADYFDIIILQLTMMGVGLIFAGNWISKNRNKIISRCLYVFRLCCCSCNILCHQATSRTD